MADQVTAMVQRFSLAEGRWEELASMLVPRMEHVMVEVGGLVTVIGGKEAVHSEQLVEGEWVEHVAHTPVVMLSAVAVVGAHYHC